MTRIEQASAAIRTARSAIAALGAAAFQQEQWDEVSRLTDIGRRLENLDQDLAPTGSTATESRWISQADVAAVPRPVNGTTATAAKSRAKINYPLFCRDGDLLVKIAWSKSRRMEYEHKSPRKVLTALVDAMLKAGPRGKRFAMEKLLPLPDPETPGQHLPDYQPYVCLAWLRQQKLVEQFGRSGYSIPKPESLSAAVANCWEKLESR